MRVLIIKLTSMGDLMHAFPALTDAVQRIPNISFDWVVDESFAQVPKWHPAVNRVITTAHRRWKKTLWQCWRKGELSHFYQQLNAEDYDVVVDLQSNIKSAVVSKLRKGVVHGYNKHTCREKPAHWAYKKQYDIDLYQHAIERQRELLANILGYKRPDTPADYGVVFDKPSRPLESISEAFSGVLPEKYVVFVHNASWPTKLWPVEYWQQLIGRVVEQGYCVLLPCGSTAEHVRAKAIASVCPQAIALPKMSLNDMAALVGGASAAVCSDTGLAHMAAVLSTPAITLYAVTDTVLIGTYGQHQQHLVAEGEQAAMADISVQQVLAQLAPLLTP